MTAKKIRDLFDGTLENKEVEIRGWIYRTRESGGIVFSTIRDSTGIIQVTTIKDQTDEASFMDAQKASIESSVIVKGILVKDKRAPDGFEIRTKSFKIIGPSEQYPITKDFDEEYLLDMRHLWLRSRKMTAVLKIRSTIFRSLRDFLDNEGYCEVQPPMFTESGSEGGSTLFEVPYFGKKMYLTQSWQLYGETFIYSVEKAYTVAPSFRAEKSKTARHLTEFWHAEVEAAWEHFDDIIKLAENLVTYICRKVAELNAEELKILGQSKEKLLSITAPFPRITYTEALRILKEHDLIIEFGNDLGQTEEREIGKYFEKPIFITHYPKEIMAFYKLKDPENPNFCLNFNLIVPEVGEMIDGSERESSIEEILKSLSSKNIDPKTNQWYLDSRRYGSIPHSGFGLGLDRLVMWICGLSSIKDAIAFPRTMTRTRP